MNEEWIVMMITEALEEYINSDSINDKAFTIGKVAFGLNLLKKAYDDKPVIKLIELIYNDFIHFEGKGWHKHD